MTTGDRVSATASVLEEMTSSIMTRKKAGAAQLTPVGTEVRRPQALPTVPGAMFPNDMPAETIIQRLDMIEEQVQLILVATATVRQMLAGQATVVDTASVQQARERAGDEAARQRQAAAQPRDSEEVYEEALQADLAASVAAVSAHMDQKAIEAQAAVFGTPDDGWTCPKHSKHATETTRKGRKYRVCPVRDCGEFERL